MTDRTLGNADQTQPHVDLAKALVHLLQLRHQGDEGLYAERLERQFGPAHHGRMRPSGRLLLQHRKPALVAGQQGRGVLLLVTAHHQPPVRSPSDFSSHMKACWALVRA